MGDGAASAAADAMPVWRLLEAERPDRSARRVLTWIQRLFLVLLAAGLAWAFWRHADAAFATLYALVFAGFFAAISLRLVAAAASLATPPPTPPPPAPTEAPLYTILVPLYREATVVADLAAALSRITYPRERLDIKFVVEMDDVETRAALEHLPALSPYEVVMVAEEGPRTKPKALNIALATARGEFLTVYDAEDRPHPEQLNAAIAAFARGGPQLACVQAPLFVDNARDSWIAEQFATEYAIQFGEILPLLTRFGLPAPLGGTSNHFRVSALREARGWDSWNVTEDADLGYRLARKGWRIGLIDPPTWEEAPVSARAWMRQRTRWLKGHMQTWLVLMRNPIRTAREMGLGAFASMHLVLGGGVVAAFLHGPIAALVLLTLLTPLELMGPQDVALGLYGYAATLYGGLVAAAKHGAPGMVRAAATMPFYWPLATLAAFEALRDLMLRPHFWAKTQHGLSQRRPIGAAANTSV